LRELNREDRERIFNLGYFTWVEQQGMTIEDFRIRKDPQFWADLPKIVTDWDRMIEEFNVRTGALEAL
jgi:cysteine synthase A